MDAVPGYVSVVFLVTAFAAVGFLLQAVKVVGLDAVPSKILLFLLPLWIIFQCVLSIGAFYQNTDSLPPRLFVVGIVPPLVLMISFFLFFRASFIERLPLKLLTILHIVRIPVEMVLYWLFLGSLVPRAMTFAGWNYDIASGIFALIVYAFAFRGKNLNKGIIICFNLIGLSLLLVIVITAALSIPSAMQQIAFEQPNKAVLLFPYSLLPTLVVPIVLFAHLAAVWKLATDRTT
jgi:hypothetical protein